MQDENAIIAAEITADDEDEMRKIAAKRAEETREIEQMEDKINSLQQEIDREKAKPTPSNSNASIPTYPTYANKTSPSASELMALKLKEEMRQFKADNQREITQLQAEWEEERNQRIEEQKQLRLKYDEYAANFCSKQQNDIAHKLKQADDQVTQSQLNAKAKADADTA